MAFNGTGTFLRIYNWVTDKTNSVPITASRMDTEMDGMATGLSNCITKDGQTIITGNIPMNSFKFTGLGVGNARTNSLTLGQVQDGQFTALGTTGGAADAYTATPNPAITAYVATMRYSAKIHATNLTTTPTLLISAISGGTIKKLSSTKTEIAVEAGDMLINGIYYFDRNSANDAWILVNPERGFDSNILDNNSVNNLGLAASVAASALTIALKTKAGTDPSVGDPVRISFRNATLTTGTYNTRSSTAATSLVISSGSTLGTTNAVASNVYVYALDNAGSIELGVSLTRFENNSIQTSVAEGGAGAADSSTVLYSTTARSSVPVRLIGMVTSTQATAGTWASAPTVINLSPFIGTIVQVLNTQTGAVASGTTQIPYDDTPPLNTEGDQYMSLTITPASAANKLSIQVILNFANSSGATAQTTALFQDSTANALAAVGDACTSGGVPSVMVLNHYMIAGTTSATTFKVRAGPSSATTFTFNGSGATRRYGGVITSSITIIEIAA